jgi:hypothetical protein
MVKLGRFGVRMAVIAVASAFGAILRAATYRSPVSDDSPGARVAAERPACVRTLEARDEPSFLRRLGFTSPRLARAFLDENAELLNDTKRELMKEISARLRSLERCMSYDSQPHPFTRIEFEWQIDVGAHHARAYAFELRSAVGSSKDSFGPCFNKSFAEPIVLSSPASGTRRLASYRGLAPWIVQHDI